MMWCQIFLVCERVCARPQSSFTTCVEHGRSRILISDFKFSSLLTHVSLASRDRLIYSTGFYYAFAFFCVCAIPSFPFLQYGCRCVWLEPISYGIFVSFPCSTDTNQPAKQHHKMCLAVLRHKIETEKAKIRMKHTLKCKQQWSEHKRI